MEFLPIRTWGTPTGRPVVLLHGFASDGRAWADIAAQLPDVWVIAPDLPGCGEAASLRLLGADATARWQALSDLLARSLARHVAVPPILVGYSLGGRVAASAVLAGGLQVAGLLLESARSGLDPALRPARQAADEMRALQIERDGIGAFVDAWQTLPVFSTQRQLHEPAVAARVSAQRELRLAQDPAGLAWNLRAFGLASLPELTARPELPGQILVGARDVPCVESVPTWRDLLPRAEVAIVPRAGHNVHLEQPAAFLRALRALLASC